MNLDGLSFLVRAAASVGVMHNASAREVFMGVARTATWRFWTTAACAYTSTSHGEHAKGPAPMSLSK